MAYMTTHNRKNTCAKTGRKLISHTVHNKNARYAALSDVDGTITRGSFVLDHACYIHDTQIADLETLPNEWRNDPKNESLITALAEAYRDSIVGKTLSDLHTDDFISNYINQNEKFYSTFKTLTKLQKQGWEIQLISGSPDYLIEPFANAFGFHGNGSAYDTDENGRITGHVDGLFNAEAKQKLVSNLNLARFKYVIAFGDTMSDKPLFDHADRSTLVAPNEYTQMNLSAHAIIYD